MDKRKVLAAAILAMPGVVAGASPASAGSAAFHCIQHDEWPLRKWDCNGAGVEYGTHACVSHWTDDDNDGSWTDTYSRPISVSCAGESGVTTCTEASFATTWDCTALRVGLPGYVVCQIDWRDDDPDPWFDAGAVKKSQLCVDPV